MKSGSRVVIHYSSTHEKTLPDGSIRRRMELHRASFARPQRTRTAQDQPYAPAPVFDIIERMGIKLSFMPIPSLEGVYQGPPNPVILVSSDRPPGRQAYTGRMSLDTTFTGMVWRLAWRATMRGRNRPRV
jgi:hypothetical protein